ncbi:MAG: LrgB family protein [Pseudomonadota bacterium]
MTEVTTLWVYLSASPLTWLTATLIAYLIGHAAFRASGGRPIVNAVVIAVALIGGALLITDTPYATYFEGAKFIHFLLGPATVALALPLWFNRASIRRSLIPMAAALLAGSVTAVVMAVAVGLALGASPETILALAPKSATAPIAMGVAEGIGGAPALTAVLVVLTGVTGAVIATPLLNLIRVHDARARGFAIGVTSHGIGAARAFQESERTGAFAGIGMGLNGLATAIIVPLIVAWLL